MEQRNIKNQLVKEDNNIMIMLYHIHKLSDTKLSDTKLYGTEPYRTIGRRTLMSKCLSGRRGIRTPMLRCLSGSRGIEKTLYMLPNLSEAINQRKHISEPLYYRKGNSVNRMGSYSVFLILRNGSVFSPTHKKGVIYS